MVVVEPVLTLVALDHELVHVLRCVRLLARTVAIEEVGVVEVSLILVIEFVVEKLARLGHPAVPTITAEVESGVELNHIVTFMAIDHAANAKAMGLEVLYKLPIVWQASFHF